jgi:hypothetical protein
MRWILLPPAAPLSFLIDDMIIWRAGRKNWAILPPPVVETEGWVDRRRRLKQKQRSRGSVVPQQQPRSLAFCRRSNRSSQRRKTERRRGQAAHDSPLDGDVTILRETVGDLRVSVAEVKEGLTHIKQRVSNLETREDARKTP